MSEEIVREEEVETPEEQPIEEFDIELDDEVEGDDSSDDLAEALKEKDAKIKELEALIVKNKKDSKPIKKQNDGDLSDVRQSISELKMAEQKRQFGYENNLSPDETDIVYRFNPKPTSETLKLIPVVGALEAMRKQKKVSDNTPKSTSRSPRFELPKKDNLSSDEKQKAFNEYLERKRQEKYQK